MERLSSEIVMDILSRLPVRSIMLCRLVSKPLLNLTHEPGFIKMHLDRSLFEDTYKLIVSRSFCLFGDPNNRMYFLECNDALYDYTCTDVKFSKEQPKFEESRVMGSCNGILCLVESNMEEFLGPIYLCNPFTRQYLKLPDPFPMYFALPGPRGYNSETAVGFGFVPATNEYKVVAIRNFDTMNGWGDVFVFTLGDISWRGRGRTPCPFNFLMSPKHVFVNGALHWYSYPPANAIVAFDISEEVVRMIDPPPNTGSRFCVGVLSGCLSVSGFARRGHAEIWIMKEYAVRDSWTKHYVIDFSGVGPNMGDIRTVCLQKNGELLLLYGHGELVLYNLSTKILRKSNIVGPSPMFEVVTHVPSLVSPLNCRSNSR